MPPHPPNISVNFLKIPHKMRPYQAIFNWSIFDFFFSYRTGIAFFFTNLNFLIILKFRNHDFLNKKKGKVIFFFNRNIFFKKLNFQKMPAREQFTKKKYQHLKQKYHVFNIVITTCFGIKNIISRKNVPFFCYYI